jgi:RNA polymerase sigma factor (sigma-70 family)
MPLMFAPAMLDRAYERARAGRWALAKPVFEAALTRGARRAFAGTNPTRRELDAFIDALHLEDLALACACEQGHEEAWEHFIEAYRPVLYRAAAAIDSSGGARDLADSIYADLYGARGAGPDRRSLFEYFHGRSSLATWLRAILAQRHVDRIRGERRVEPFPAHDEVAASSAAPDPDRARLAALVLAALANAIQQLPTRDRLKLRAYYEQGLTLAELGRLTGEHEATISRHLARLRRTLRESIDAEIRRDPRVGEAGAAECWQAALDDPGAFDLRKVFNMRPVQETAPGSFKVLK